MTIINLLNWRDRQTQIQNNRFFIMIGGVVFICMLVILCINIAVRNKINKSQNEILYLNGEINKIEPKISKVKGLQQQKELLLSRRVVVDSLQDTRPLTVKIFDNLAKVVPNGVVFSQLSRKGDHLFIDGVADTNAAISNLMKNIERLRWAKDAKLTEIKTLDSNEKNSQATGKNKQAINSNAEGGKVSFKLQISLAPPLVGVKK